MKLGPGRSQASESLLLVPAQGENNLLPFIFSDAVAATARTILVVAQPIMFVDARLVINCMTTGTGGCIPRGRPINEFRVGLMANGAGEVAAVIEWLVCQTYVTVIRRCPGNRTVAQTAILRSVEVIWILACRSSSVVT